MTLSAAKAELSVTQIGATVQIVGCLLLLVNYLAAAIVIDIAAVVAWTLFYKCKKREIERLRGDLARL